MILFDVHITSNKSHTISDDCRTSKIESIIPGDISFKTPHLLLLTPHIRSNMLNNLSRSSNDHRRGDIEPISNIPQEIARKPFNTLVNSTHITLSKDVLTEITINSGNSIRMQQTRSLYTTLT